MIDELVRQGPPRPTGIPMSAAYAVGPETIKQQVERSIKQAEERLSKATELQELLEKNPELERALTLLREAF